MGTPLYTALLELSRRNSLRLHMPGHKGRAGALFRDIAAIDFTELDPTGNLYTGEGPIAPAEDLCAEAAGAGDALFFTCGATQGIFTMLAAAVGMGGTLILDRGCHKSVYHGMGLLDITPRYFYPSLLPEIGLPAPVTPDLLHRTLNEHPEARAVFLTSPSYYGIRTEIGPLAELCHQFGVYLLVDEAHGAHFPFVGVPSAVSQGADLAVVSTHKTWPALGASSVLYRNPCFSLSKQQLKTISSIFATTSPSYPILASIDYARNVLEGQAGDAYRQAAVCTALLRKTVNEETPFHALWEKDGLLLDPCRFAVDTLRGSLSGRDADTRLQRENIYLEMADERYFVAIFTCHDQADSFDRLSAGIRYLAREAVTTTPPLTFSPPPPEIRCSIRSALFGPVESLPLRKSVGQISAEILAPYPPGIPIVAPGEEITEKHIAYLQKKSYNIDKSIAVVKNR